MINIFSISYSKYDIMSINSMVICFIFLCSLWFCHSRHWSHRFYNPLFFVYLFTLLTLSGEIVWKFIDGKSNLIWLNYIANMFSLGGCLFIGYFWLMYCFKAFHYKWCKKFWVKFIFLIPTIIEVSLVLLSPVLKLMFYIDDAGKYYRGPLFILQSIGYIYIFVGSIIAISSIRKVSMSVEKAHLKILALAALPCFVISLVQFFLPAGGLPYFQFSMFLSLCGVFVHDEERQITVDGLTKLKTRYEFERILNDKIKRIKSDDNKSLYVIAGDINLFKNINDTYGHKEGDIVISTVGDIMDQATISIKAIACRRSGDEFLIAVECDDESLVSELINNINDKIRQFNETKKYSISLSFGIAKFNGSEHVMDLVNRADDLMYVEKSKFKKEL